MERAKVIEVFEALGVVADYAEETLQEATDDYAIECRAGCRKGAVDSVVRDLNRASLLLRVCGEYLAHFPDTFCDVDEIQPVKPKESVKLDSEGIPF